LGASSGGTMADSAVAVAALGEFMPPVCPSGTGCERVSAVSGALTTKLYHMGSLMREGHVDAWRCL
jgi:hypothetical protein